MTAGFLGPAFGVWPPGAPAFNKTDSTLTLYLDPVAGDDDKPGTSRANAVRTPARIADLIPLYAGNVDVRMRSGAAVLPDRGWFLGSRLLNGLLTFTADEAWDPAVFTVIGGNRTADAGTTALVVKASGLVVDALKDLSMRFVDGPAVGQYRRVRNNTATDVVPSEQWDPAPDPGDTYQLFTSNAYFALPDNGAQQDFYAFINDCSATRGSNFDGNLFQWFARPTGVLIDGVGLRGGQGAYAYHFGRVPLYLYGVDASEDFLQADFHMFGVGTAIYSGHALQIPQYALKLGWGLAAAAAPFVDGGGQLIGCWNVGYVDLAFAGDGQFYGGRYGYIYNFGDAATSTRFTEDFKSYWQGGAGIYPLFDDTTQTGAYLVSVQYGTCYIRSGVMVGTFLVNVEYGARLFISSSVTGTPAVRVRRGGQLQCDGTVNLGGAGNDWTVANLAAFNKSAFVGTPIKQGNDLSQAQRY